jgi:hypothetical protein
VVRLGIVLGFPALLSPTDSPSELSESLFEEELDILINDNYFAPFRSLSFKPCSANEMDNKDEGGPSIFATLNTNNLLQNIQ